MIKIAFHINSFLVGGIEKTMLQQLSFFRPPEYDVHFLISHDMGAREELRSEIPSYVKVTHLISSHSLVWTKQLKSQGKLSPFLKIYDELLQPLRKIERQRMLNNVAHDADVIVDFDLTLGTLLKDLSCKKIGWLHFSLDHYHRGNVRKLNRLGEKLKLYDEVIMTSDAMLDRARELYPHMQNKLSRIYNSLDQPELLQRQLDTSEIQESERPLLEKKFILSTARLEETQKDFTTLLKAYALISAKIPQDLVIIGDGRHKEQLQNLAQDLGIASRVHFLGFKRNHLIWLAKADVFVLSSHFEGLPTVLIEALMYNKIMISSDCPTGPREILKNGECGYLVPPKNPEKMAEALLQACQDGGVKNLQALQAHSQNFEKSTVVEILKKIYRP